MDYVSLIRDVLARRSPSSFTPPALPQAPPLTLPQLRELAGDRYGMGGTVGYTFPGGLDVQGSLSRGFDRTSPIGYGVGMTLRRQF